MSSNISCVTSFKTSFDDNSSSNEYFQMFWPVCIVALPLITMIGFQCAKNCCNFIKQRFFKDRISNLPTEPTDILSKLPNEILAMILAEAAIEENKVVKKNVANFPLVSKLICDVMDSDAFYHELIKKQFHFTNTWNVSLIGVKDFYDLLNDQQKLLWLIRRLLSTEDIAAAKAIIVQIKLGNFFYVLNNDGTFLKESAQLELVKASPIDENIYDTKLMIEQMREDFAKSRAQLFLVKILVSIRKFDDAKLMIEQMDPSWGHKYSVQITLVKAFLSMGKFDDAKVIIEQIIHPDYKSAAQIALVKAFLSMGQIDDAKLIIEQIEVSSRVFALRELAKVFLSMGKIDEHKAIIAQVKAIIELLEFKSPHYHKAFSQIVLVTLSPTNENIAYAKALIERVSFDNKKNELLRELARAFLYMGKIDDAKLMIEQMREDFAKSRAQLCLVKILVSIRKFDDAKWMIEQIESPYYKAKAIIELVKVFLSMGKINDAKWMIEQIKDPYYKAKAIIELVKTLLTKEKAYCNLNMIDNLIQYVEIKALKIFTYCKKVFFKFRMRQPQENIDKARAIIEQIQNSDQKIKAQFMFKKALFKLVKALDSMEKIDEARAIEGMF